MNDSRNSSAAPLKTQAKALRQYLAEQGIEFGHSKCLEAVARSHGHKNWNTASGARSQTKPVSADGVARDKKPYGVIMSRIEWRGDPLGHDAFDYFARSFLDEDEASVSGSPDAVEVHSALCEGRAVPPHLGARVLGVCYSDEEWEATYQRLTEAFRLINPARRAALWAVFQEGPYPHLEETVPDRGDAWSLTRRSETASSSDPTSPVERAYRRGVGQTLAELLRRWESAPPETVEGAMGQVRALEKRSLHLRRGLREISLYLDELWSGSRAQGGA